MFLAMLIGVIVTLISIPLLAKANVYFASKGYAAIPTGVLAVLAMILGGAFALLAYSVVSLF